MFLTAIILKAEPDKVMGVLQLSIFHLFMSCVLVSASAMPEILETRDGIVNFLWRITSSLLLGRG